ncbi:MAG: hypothetical protein U9N62_05290 [Thermotogota bacterium]|nr:hypothetical protein [Thermotogota bacterium]
MTTRLNPTKNQLPSMTGLNMGYMYLPSRAKEIPKIEYKTGYKKKYKDSLIFSGFCGIDLVKNNKITPVMGTIVCVQMLDGENNQELSEPGLV